MYINSWLSAGTPCLFDRYLNPKKAYNEVFNHDKNEMNFTRTQ
jgi:hypothetical protein